MNWKDRIEAQIAWLAMEPEPRTQDCAQVMRDLLDVAVAADRYAVSPYCKPVQTALDKLREAEDETVV